MKSGTDRSERHNAVLPHIRNKHHRSRLAHALLATAATMAFTLAPSAFAEETRYVLSSQGTNIGTMTVDAQGKTETITYRAIVNDRGPDLRAAVTVDEAGRPASYEISGKQLVNTPVAEKFDSAADTRFTLPKTDIPEFKAILVRALLRAPGKKLLLSDGRTVQVEMAGTSSLNNESGAKTVSLMLVTGLESEVMPVWVDAGGALVALLTPRDTVIAAGWEKSASSLKELQDLKVDAHDIALAASLVDRPKGPVMFRHVRIFDSKAKVMRPDMAVLVSGSRIAAVGADGSLAVPAGTREIDGTGKTLMPGMWDMHVHLRDNLEGMVHLAYGVTTARDMGNDIPSVLNWRRRYASGEMAGPRLLLAGLIDGKSATNAAGVLISSSEELSRAITNFADNGYQEIKIYSSFPPALIAQAKRETVARGMRMGGHVPAGMDMDDAIASGFTDVSHLYFYLLNFIDGGIKDGTATMRRVLEPAKKALDIDPSSAAVRKTLAEMRARDVTFDVTAVVVAQLFGDGAKNKGFLATNPQEAATYAKSEKRAMELLKGIHDAGVPMVAGTDGPSGSGYIDELEIYQQARIPKADILYIATLAPARMMKLDADLGSIEPGKIADMVLVDGNPLVELNSLRRAVFTVKNGDIYDIARLKQAIGEKPVAKP